MGFKHQSKTRFFVLVLLVGLGSLNLNAAVLHQRVPAPPPKRIDPSPVKGEVLKNRWDIKPPPHELNVKGKTIDPYNQNKLKGDTPIIGQDVFFIFTAQSETLFEHRKLPIPSAASAAGAGRFSFFGNGNLTSINQNFRFTLELYKGNTAFEPRKWEVRVTPVFNINRLQARERGVINANVARGTVRNEFDFALQEALAEYHLGNVSDRFDFISLRGGIQPFTSDLRGFVFTDTNLGGRLFGNFGNNKYQWNAAFFDLLEKNTNSELNMLDRRRQEVLVVNLFKQDFFDLPGWTNQFSIVWNHDQATKHFDQNGVLTRPDPVGAAKKHDLDAVYFGWTSDGHIGRFNVAHAFYFVTGRDQNNPIASRDLDIFAQMAALELSYDRDWYRLKTSFFFATGDDEPRDDTGKGFDAVVDFPKFAGGENSFFHRQNIRLNGINLTQRNSFLTNLRSSKTEGQSNFVNPGLFLANVGTDIEVIPQLKALVNANYLYFLETAPLELFLNQANIRNEIGWDMSLGLQYRPFLNNNVILNLNGAYFLPGAGFRDILTSQDLYQVFSNLVLTY
ncbi:MAG TPA: hypothetical protein DDW49_04045 [Deltaproteobacteria bacterium]|nr:hypothetical protein [Deltaproteobacteria bacterium]